jgi:hypothetical protein
MPLMALVVNGSQRDNDDDDVQQGSKAFPSRSLYGGKPLLETVDVKAMVNNACRGKGLGSLLQHVQSKPDED